MSGRRTPAWWAARIELGIGSGAVLLMGLWTFAWGGPADPCFGCGRSSVGLLWISISSQSLISLAGFLVALGGLIWMIRILRGPRDEPPPWRHRAR